MHKSAMGTLEKHTSKFQFWGLSIRSKLLGSLFLMFLLIGFASYVSIRDAEKVSNSFEQFLEKDEPALWTLMEIKGLTHEMRMRATELKLAGWKPEWAARSVEEEKIRLQENVAQMEMLIGEWRGYRAVHEKQGQVLPQLVSEAGNELVRAMREWVQWGGTNASNKQVLDRWQELDGVLYHATAIFNEEIEEEKGRRWRFERQVDQTAVATLLAHSGVAVAAIGFALLMGIRLPLSISRRLRKLQDAVSRIEGGDLTSRVEVGPRDEIGNLTQGLNAMLDQIQENILQKEKEGEELKSRAEEITRTSSELETFNMLAVGREQRIVELKRKINELSKQMGKSSPYDLSFIEGSRQRDLETEESDS